MFLKNIIYRLLQYRSSVLEFKTLGFQKIFSSNLANAAGVSAEQVRKDFSLFDIKGNKKGGYIIEELLKNLNQILQKNKKEKVIIVGLGNIGKALAQYKGFTSDNLEIIAGFDIDPAKHNTQLDFPVYSTNLITTIVAEHKIKIAILSIPSIVAQEMVELLVNSGIKGILNFTPIILKVPEHVEVNNINLTNEINNLIYFIRMQDKKAN